MWHLEFPQFGRLESSTYIDHRVACVAREIRSVCGQTKSERFDPFVAAARLGIDVRIVPMSSGEHGLVRMDLPVLTIELVNSGTPLRQRFTLCHELAHLCFVELAPWILNSDRPYAHSNVDRREEQLCDAIAAELLMPKNSFKKRARDMVPGFSAVCELSQHYHVSVAAVITRLERTRSWSIARASWDIQRGIVSPPRLRSFVLCSRLRKAFCARARDDMRRAFELAGVRLGQDWNGLRELSSRLDAGKYVVVDTLDLAVTTVRLASNPYLVGGTVFH